MFASQLAYAPLEIAYCSYFIFKCLGWSSLSGVVLWMARLAFQRALKGRKMEFHARMQELSERVTQKTIEAFAHIRVLKLYGWESRFEE